MESVRARRFSLMGLNASRIRLGVVVLETSFDLLNWEPFATNRLSAGVNLLNDLDLALFPNRFYRLHVQ